jgi:hypothetical protein
VELATANGQAYKSFTFMKGRNGTDAFVALGLREAEVRSCLSLILSVFHKPMRDE